MQILRNILTDVTPLHREARMVQQMIHVIMRCGAQHPLMILLELQRAGVVLTEKELKDMILSMERQGLLKFPKAPEAQAPTNGVPRETEPVSEKPETQTVPINSNGESKIE